MEGLSSLLVFQKLGQEGKRLVGEGEVYQFALLIASAAAYVLSAWWIVVVRHILSFLYLIHPIFNSLTLRPRHLLFLPLSWVSPSLPSFSLRLLVLS